MIEIDHVSKEFAGKPAVDDLTLSVRPGEVFAFLGPNGAGKTTTIKMITGLLRPTRGRITVAGIDIHDDYLRAKELLAYVPDEPYLYDKLSGREFLRFIADLYGMKGNGVSGEIERLVGLFRMAEYVDELTETYSHGMKQRVVLAATLLHHPKVMVVDEPLVGLDPHSALLVKRIFREEAARGTTIFVSTHLLSIVEEVADRVGIITYGRLVACGTPAELRAGRAGKSIEEIFMDLLGPDGVVLPGAALQAQPSTSGAPGPGGGGEAPR